MDKDHTTRGFETAYLDSRRSRWLDGVGFGGTVLVALVATLWSLVNVWATGWSPSGAIGVVLVTILLTALGFRHRVKWHAQKLDRQRVGALSGGQAKGT